YAGDVCDYSITPLEGIAAVDAGPDICNTGDVQLNVSGGGVGATYSWLPATGLDDPNIQNPVANPTTTTTYTVTVSNTGSNPLCPDASYSDEVVIYEHDVTIDVTTPGTVTDISCYESTNGESTPLVSPGDASDFSFAWNTTPEQTTQTATNLTEGNYTVTITETATGCTASESVTVTEPDKMDVTYSFTPATCYGTDGTVTVESVTNGVGPNYSFTWSNSQTGETVTGLETGSYYVATIVDNSNDGCTAIYDPNPNTVEITSTTETGNTYYWYGNINTYWENGKNWCRATTPEYPQLTTDDVIIQNVAVDCIIPDDGVVYRCHDITIDGVLNEAGSNSNLNVSGFWKNNNTFTQNGGTITFEGSSLQSVQSGGSSFSNVVVNNTGDGLTLSDNMTIQSNLTLTEGIITTGANMVEVLNADPPAVNNGNSGAYVFGNLRRHVASNTGTYGFPVGTSTAYRLAEIINNNMTGLTYLDASFITPFDNTGSLDPDIAQDFGTPYTSVADEGIWKITPDVQPGSGLYSVHLWFDDGGGTEAFAGLEDNCFGHLKRPDVSTSASEWSAVDGTLNANGGPGRVVADGYAARNDLSAFSEFAIGKTKGTPLPIELVRFTINCHNGNAVVSWTTASETNNDFFTIYRSTSPESLKPIAKVPGQGTSILVHEYTYIDENPENNQLYYKLKQTDFDGIISWSKVVFVSCLQDMGEFYITPNPFKENLYIIFNEPTKQTYHIKIFDMLGKLVYADEIPAKSQRITIGDIEHLIPGTYYLRLQSQDNIKTQKLIKM
ncbi:MAG: T9SS type A sorting domain-containing protein, partial [Candidatus Delongbacteria bacterium]|nr:T9SS type A sorting domain-containing protein [Candidatus Delongbacteria bacterium]